MKEYNYQKYLLPENSGHVPYHRKGEMKQVLKTVGTSIGIGAVGILVLLSAVATGVAVRGESMRIPLGENSTLIDFYVDKYTNPPSQSMDILEGYCPPPLTTAPQYQQSKKFLFQFAADGTPSTDVNIIELCR
jgi:hypothetical protein